MNEEGRRLDQITDSLLQIEVELRKLGEWQSDVPPAEAFESTQPFCLDTMDFTQWLQFVFIERMKQLVEADMPLPSASGIAPMAEEHFRGRSQSGAGLIRVLVEMDTLLSGS